MNNSVLQIHNSNKTCLGTGFVVDKDEKGVYVATCGHVINNCGLDILVDGKIAKVIQNHYCDGLDLAIVYVEGLILNPLSISIDNSTTAVKVIGYSKLLDNPKREPINDIKIKYDIEFNTPKKISAIKLYPDEAISKGYSGSPVICQKSNNVIGIVNIQVGNDTNYAIHIKHLHEVYSIKSNTKIEDVSQEKIYNGLVSHIDKENYSYITRNFEKRFEKSLQSFSGLPKLWIKPRIHTVDENSNVVSSSNTNVNFEDILINPKSLIIKAKQQYGLTSLSHYLVKEAWMKEVPSLWLYLDARELKPHTNEIEKIVVSKLNDMNLIMDDIECIVLDEFSSSIKDANKIFNKVSSFFKLKPLIVMMTIADNPLLNENISVPENRNFEMRYLWALPRNDIREVVSKYNDKNYIGDENDVINKVILDLEVLNIPRTAFNCLTILKISEAGFDDSPVNRTEMLGRILSLLFNVEDIPRYKTRPDLKDTEYILGYFCELMLKKKNYDFTREEFLTILNSFCKEREIDLDIEIVFDVLYKNNIIIDKFQEYCFKFSYWIFYFSAQRMHQNSDFSKFILQDMNYVSYPEIVEFYTGIDRRRDDALGILTEDLSKTRELVNSKYGLPFEFDIYNSAQWTPTEEKIERMHDEIKDGVLDSNLPEIVKDQYSDKGYNRTRPLNQNIHTILEEYSLLRLMRAVQASSKALRNSDQSDPIARHRLLDEILLSWEEIIKGLLVLAPVLANNGHATLEGASFVLVEEDFDTSPEKRLYQILEIIPMNIVDWYKDDLYSKKMTTLIYNHLESETSNLRKHLLSLFIIHKRPNGWYKQIEQCIENENKNSYFLYSMYHTLRAEYQYSFASKKDLEGIETLIKMTNAKHSFGMKKPSQKVIKKVSDKIIPNREND